MTKSKQVELQKTSSGALEWVDLAEGALHRRLGDGFSGWVAERALMGAPSRSRAKAEIWQAVDEAADSSAGPIVFVRTRPGPRLPTGGLDREVLRAHGLAQPGVLLHVGPVERIAALVGLGLETWWESLRRGSTEIVVITGGAADLEPGKPWQAPLQRLAESSDVPIRVRHLPPGLFRWRRVVVPLFGVDSVLPGGETLRTEVGRVYRRRPRSAPNPVVVDVQRLRSPVDSPKPVAEGRPARRIYRLSAR